MYVTLENRRKSRRGRLNRSSNLTFAARDNLRNPRIFRLTFRSPSSRARPHPPVASQGDRIGRPSNEICFPRCPTSSFTFSRQAPRLPARGMQTFPSRVSRARRTSFPVYLSNRNDRTGRFENENFNQLASGMLSDFTVVSLL